MGRAVFQGIELTYEPIISAEQFERVQERMQRRRVTRPSRSGSPRLWSGHLRCAECGSAIGASHAKNNEGRTYTYYTCWRAKRSPRQLGSAPGCTHTTAYRADRMEKEWWQQMTAQLSDPVMLPTLLPPAVSATAGPPLARVQELETAIARAWEPFAADKILEQIAERLAAPYQQQLAELRAEYAPQPTVTPDYVELAGEFAQALDKAIQDEDRRMLLSLLDMQLYVHPDGSVRVQVSPP
ncbi:recombinase zinc beta ribbon domain-containing protein [Deinococcus radiophilus]|uniref:Recombinase zinc beta ribbon domain-containing protein n=2 Tax=Deinococcus radiophilus TaxID=32062 RepID=A0A431VQQ0_9DEIO|nr:hypothetical protein EJ104_10870 [Deinococcus radiophilus]UFA50929.1 recombinase zinc beta ribbon domain-containing protein [Deinococcus radiophilus]